MAPVPRSPLPRIVLYHQTVNDPEGNPISILPLLTKPGISVTHIIVAAIHVNADPLAITLNDHHPSHPRFTTLWAELRIAQASGIRVLGMLGGAAKGTFSRLDQDDVTFETYYAPVRDLVRERGLDGIDLDVEEPMSLGGIIRLIDRLRADFGPAFIITLAPVAASLLDPRKNLSGFDYEALEVMRGRDIAWYNTQFYCGWGDASNPLMYEMCMMRGWNPEKVVMGLVTTPENGSGWVPWELLGPNLTVLRRQFGHRFGGVMGWEYFNGHPGGKDKPWEWAQRMTKILRGGIFGDTNNAIQADGRTQQILGGTAPEPSSVQSSAVNASLEVDPDIEKASDLPRPHDFDYYSDFNDSSDGSDSE